MGCTPHGSGWSLCDIFYVMEAKQKKELLTGGPVPAAYKMFGENQSARMVRSMSHWRLAAFQKQPRFPMPFAKGKSV